jgi:hypothetical protein
VQDIHAAAELSKPFACPKHAELLQHALGVYCNSAMNVTASSSQHKTIIMLLNCIQSAGSP